KYTDRGGVQVQCNRERDVVCIEVTDTGVGIPEDQQPYIFDEFYRVGTTRAPTREGYGLGLSIVDRIAKLLGLSIRVSSEPGKASPWSLDVPPATGIRPTPVMESFTPVSVTASSPGHHDLLLVEDDAGVRNATRMFLKGEGYRVNTAASLQEA